MDGALKKEMTVKNCGCVFSNEFLMETIKSLASVDFHGRHGSRGRGRSRRRRRRRSVCVCGMWGWVTWGAWQTNVAAPCAGVDRDIAHAVN